MSAIMYFFALVIGFPILLLFKTKCYYEKDKQNNRLKESTIIISNHRTFLDAIVIAYRWFQRLHYIAANYYKGWLRIFRPFMIMSGGILVDLDGQRLDFIEKSKRVIAKGRSIVIFPEGDYGKCKKNYEVSTFSVGYIMLAIKTGAKILPVVNDFNYGLFKRVRLMIGNSIDLSHYSKGELTKTKIQEINEEISKKYLMLYYLLKRRKAERFKFKYDFVAAKKGDVIRIFAGSYYHYGVYLNAREVIQFGQAVNMSYEDAVVNTVSLKEFCGGKIPEIRVLKGKGKRYLRSSNEIEEYAKSCLGRGDYSLVHNNCLDFANRITLKI